VDLSFEHISSNFPNDYQNRFSLFYDLQKYKVQELLLVSSLYDDFILEEDGRLTEELTQEFSDLELSSPPPRIIRVSNGQEALEALETRSFDMVITMLRLNDMDPFHFGKEVKKHHPEMPVVLLLTNHSDTLSLPPIKARSSIDEIFTWNGDSDLFLAMIKIIEDRKNVESDTEVGSVRVVIVVEDTINYYSIFLPIIYKEILHQTQEIIEEGVNLSHRLLRRRGRPKILLAQTYEEATSLYDKYKDNLLGIITDVAFPLQSKKDYSAGVNLIRFVRIEKPYLPVLIQSSDPENNSLAVDLDAYFVHKNSMTYLRDFRKFMKQAMLFGDFVFRLPDGTEVARAKNLKNFEQVIREVPEESIRYHGKQNHFSNWLYSRGEYTLANELAPYQTEEFSSMEALRTFLIDQFEERRKEKQQGVITEFQRETFDFTSPFSRIGNGSLGGKGRGIAFISALLSRGSIGKLAENMTISIPETVVLATDIFDLFLEINDLYELLRQDLTDDVLKHKFLKAELPEGVQIDLRLIIEKTNSPLAVRSSSLLEDSQFHPLAGVYTTYMLSNDQHDDQLRYKYLSDAVKLVYASAFSKEAKSYIKSLGQKIEVEKMGVIIQKVIGKKHDSTRFYPDLSGVIKSFNYYPIRHMNPEDGIAEVAVGLGEMVVSGGQFLQFSPNYPKILPQASTVGMAFKNSQREFLSIRLDNQDVDLAKGEFSTLETLPLSVARDDGVLKWLGAVYDRNNNRIVNSVRRDGPILITLPYLLKYPKFPFAKVLRDLLEIGKESLGYSVEIEFAMNIDYEHEENHRLYVLQIRPLVIESFDYTDEEVAIIENGKGIIYSEVTLGNGKYNNIYDIIYVDPDTFDKTKTMEIKAEIGRLNRELRDQDREYLLIGPGRWGTSDRFLGIPVHWSDIDNARVLAEVALEDFQIDPSQGMHFFTNITASKRGYFTIPWNSKKASIDWEWFKNQDINYGQFDYIKHIRLERPLDIKINGKSGKGLITPGKPEIMMDPNDEPVFGL